MLTYIMLVYIMCIHREPEFESPSSLMSKRFALSHDDTFSTIFMRSRDGVCVCVFVCVYDFVSVCVCMYVCMCVRDGV